MIRYIVFTFALLIPAAAMAQNVPTVGIEDIEVFFENDNDTLYIVNFWATWCKPCIEELPAFEEIHSRYADKNVRVILVSLDFPQERERKVEPFVQRKKLRSRVVLLDAGNPNDWIDRISPEWSGAIPATVFAHSPTQTKEFFEKQFTFLELNTIVQRLIGIKQ